MSNIVLKIENLSKLYRLGEVNTGTIGHDLNRWWQELRGRENPYLKIGEANHRNTKGASDYIWALKDINLEVKKGEILGIIGENGAGKSTLLKILSKVTRPTKGKLRGKGKIASLLEVGTGFHPELTGRENIYLNGAILGMSRQEIHKKLEEIIDFAGIERHVDTPAKRYSTGMKVRLGFAVAAHLEADILIIDEVLAVGDSSFQKKCIGKMDSISRSKGKTIIFVSHNLNSINQLCKRGIVLNSGEISFNGNQIDAINHYLNSYESLNKFKLSERKDRIGNGKIIFNDAYITNNYKDNVPTNKDFVYNGTEAFFILTLTNQTNKILHNLSVVIIIKDQSGENLTSLHSRYLDLEFNEIEKQVKIRVKILKFPLSKGKYFVKLRCILNGTNKSKGGEEADCLENAFSFNVENGNFYKKESIFQPAKGKFFLPFSMNRFV